MSNVETQKARITLRAFLLGVFFSGVFAIISVTSENSAAAVEPTSNQIAVLPYILLLSTVLLINPFLKLIRFIRPFSIAELLLVFLMGTVSSGIPTCGLNNQLLPIIGSLQYRDWNSDQAQWDQYVTPNMADPYFLSEDGLQVCAEEYRTAAELRDKTQTVLDRALALKTAEIARIDTEQRAIAALQVGSVELEKQQALIANPAVLSSRERERKAKEAWSKVLQENSTLDVQIVTQQYPAQVVELAKAAMQRRDELRKASESAFKKVELFRRGLPKDQSAYPGIFPQPDDDVSSYLARFKRLIEGRSAFNVLASIHERIKALPEGEKIDASAAQAIGTELKPVFEKLEPLSGTTALEASKASLQTELNDTTKDLAETDGALSELNSKKRLASLPNQTDLDRQIREKGRRKTELESAKKVLETQLKCNAKQREMTGRVSTVMAQLKTFETDLISANGDATAGAASQKLMAVMQKFPSFDASYSRYFFGDVPWAQWSGVLLRWGLLIALTYVVLMTFNVLIFRQWAHNEKLIYPLVELPEILAGHKDNNGNPVAGGIPEVFRSGLFWVGATISGSVIGWNLLAATNLVPGLQQLDLMNRWEPYILGSSLQGLKPEVSSTIFFTMIGLAFLIPAKVSFSLWFFWIYYFLQLLILVWLGYGDDDKSFPKEWFYTMNFVSAQGGGAILVFASACLYKARRYIFCYFQPSVVKDLEVEEQRELRWSSFLFVACSMGLMLMLWKGMGANIWYVLFFYAIIMCLTITLVRAVAEGGILGFQAWAGPFHFIRNVLGFDNAWSSPTLFAPLMIYHAIFFLDIKTFIAPAMANSLKMRDDLKMERGRFHLSIFAAIMTAIVVAGGLSLMMCYSQGANGMSGWFYSQFPREMFGYVKSVGQNPPTASMPNTLWILTGASTMGLLLFFRQSMFWLPHPIGLIMLVNPIMHRYWFSIMLGWLAKHLVTKYGNRDTYSQVRAFFIGLIVGELVVVSISLVLGYVLGIKLGIDLDRNGS